MRLHTRLQSKLAFAVSAVLLCVAPAGAEEPGPAPNASTSAPAEVKIYLRSPAELDSLWKPLQQPDFILLRGSDLQGLIAREKNSSPSGRSPDAALEAVSVRGEVQADVAELRVEYTVSTSAEGRSWIGIHLDGQNLTAVREGDRERPLRATASGSWEVECDGPGVHRIRAELLTRLKVTGEGRVLELAIPEAASTTLSLTVPGKVVVADSGPAEPVTIEPQEKGEKTRLSSSLTPRARLNLRWTGETEPGSQLPPLLMARGEIAVDVDPASFRTRSSWSIHSVRGSTRNLEFRLDPEDEVLELELDGQPTFAGLERQGSSTRLTIPLAEPLRAGPPRHLVMTTRRTISAGSATRLTFRGFALTDAKEQSGAIGIAPSGNLWISGSAGQGLREIDPRTELTPDLRSRPTTVLAYQFNDQPFELGLRVEPSPPLVRTEARTTVALSPRLALVDAWLDYRTAHGRLFELEIALPRGLEVDAVGPNEVVEASTLGNQASAGGSASGLEPARLLNVRLAPLARERGEFSLHVVGRQRIDPARPIRIGLPQPRDVSSDGGRIAVLADRSLTVEGAGKDDGSGVPEFRAAALDPPADWPWPSGQTGPPALWLRYDGTPAGLSLIAALHQRSLERKTHVRAEVDRRWLDLTESVDCTVHFGSIKEIEIGVPPELQGLWEVEDAAIARREDLGKGPRGERRYRLRLARQSHDQVRLRFRARVPLSPALEAARTSELQLPLIRVRDGTPGSVNVEVASDPGVRIDGLGSGWTRPEPETPDIAMRGPEVRQTWTGPEASAETLRLSATLLATAPLPSLFAPRLWLRTTHGSNGDVRVFASFWVESHGRTFDMALPPGAEWIYAKAGGETVLPESLGGGRSYRFRFPRHLGSAPVSVELAYNLASAPPHAGDLAPRFTDGGAVEQTYWEVRVPWNQAVVGVPSGWTDENAWVWDRYHWKRKPWKSSAALAGWARGASSWELAGDVANEDPEGSHLYLFGRSGVPAAIHPFVVSRAALLTLCSGAALALGILLLFWHPPARLVLITGAIALAVAMAVDPNVTFLVVQSAMVGAILAPLAALLERLLERRGRSMSVFGEGNGLLISQNSGSSLTAVFGVGSDDSTAIRVRPSPTTIDHLRIPDAGDAERRSGHDDRDQQS